MTSLTITDTINPYDLDVLNRVGKNWEHLKHIVGFDQIGNILRCKLLHLSSFVNEDNELSRIEVLENCMELGTMNNNKVKISDASNTRASIGTKSGPGIQRRFYIL